VGGWAQKLLFRYLGQDVREVFHEANFSTILFSQKTGAPYVQYLQVLFGMHSKNEQESGVNVPNNAIFTSEWKQKVAELQLALGILLNFVCLPCNMDLKQ
jgi:hypothetical protein